MSSQKYFQYGVWYLTRLGLVIYQNGVNRFSIFVIKSSYFKEMRKKITQKVSLETWLTNEITGRFLTKVVEKRHNKNGTTELLKGYCNI